MDNLQRIKTASLRIKKTCSVIIFCIPLLLALYWIFLNDWPIMPLQELPFPNGVPDHVHALPRFLGFWIQMIPYSVILYGLLRIRELFRLYENGIIFTEKNVSCFRRLGWVLILWVISDVIEIALLSSVLYMDSPGPIHGQIILGLTHFIGIFVGFIILIIAWVMDEARKIHEDQTLFI